ncbi:MAG: preprotein translocase subunit SecY, partial [Planctomycetota bacterium]|nr:preprotein translocase subunit SecY [Planctomycetota bacterium]
MQGNFLQLFKIPETREKIFRTLGLLICYRIGFQVPIPGMDPAFVKDMSSQGVLGLLSALSGGSLGDTTVFALGIMPFISASIIFSM